MITATFNFTTNTSLPNCKKNQNKLRNKYATFTPTSNFIILI